MVFAMHHPAITAIFPHKSSLRAITRAGRDFSDLNDIKSGRTVSKKALTMPMAVEEWAFSGQAFRRRPALELLGRASPVRWSQGL
jgi:hypothetical protein